MDDQIVTPTPCIARRLCLDDKQRRIVRDLIAAPQDRAAKGLSAISPHENR